MPKLAPPHSFSNKNRVEQPTPRVNPALRLPCRLASLPVHAREAVGRAIDAGIARMVFGSRGEILVAKAR
jgi:hypothetical protein